MSDEYDKNVLSLTIDPNDGQTSAVTIEVSRIKNVNTYEYATFIRQDDELIMLQPLTSRKVAESQAWRLFSIIGMR